MKSTKNTEKWKWRSSTASTTGSLSPYQYATESSEPVVESKKSRSLSKAFRSMSSSSLDSMSSGPSRSGSSARKLHKTPSGSGSMIERLQRRVSRDSSISTAPSEIPGSPLEPSYTAMEMIRYGWLKADSSLLKARSEYLVLTDHSLVKFGSAEAARSVFPQLTQTGSQGKGAQSHYLHSLTSKSAFAEIRYDIPLRSIIAVYNEETSSSRCGIEVWWSSRSPKIASCKAHFHFALPKERDDWLADIQQAYKARMRKNPIHVTVPENIKIRINHAMHPAETSDDSAPQSLIFPVAKRYAPAAQKGASADESQDIIDAATYYLAIGPYVCYLVEILKADNSTLPGDLRLKTSDWGTVSLTRFQALVASYEQRFMISFR